MIDVFCEVVREGGRREGRYGVKGARAGGEERAERAYVGGYREILLRVVGVLWGSWKRVRGKYVGLVDV